MKGDVYPPKRQMEDLVPAYFSGTTNALRKGVTKMSADAAIKKIEGWEEALQEVEIPGVRAILRDLGALKRQLDQDEPDGDRIRDDTFASRGCNGKNLREG